VPRALALLLIATALYRFSLLDRGTSAFVDETLYFTSVMSLRSLTDGDVRGAAYHITQARGRQGAAILNLPLAALQSIPSAFGVPASNPRSLLIPTTANVLLSLVTLWLLYATAQALTGSGSAALFAAGLHAFLVNSNLYVRHVLPYELSLALATTATWWLSTRVHSPRGAAAGGALTAAAVTCYSGYYLVAAVIAAAFAATVWHREGVRPATIATTAFGAGAAAMFALIEVICRIGGTGYFASSRALGGTITMGAFEEGWIFLPRYLWEVEGLAGVVLLAGIACWLVVAGRRLLRREIRVFDIWIGAAVGGWIVQAVLSAELEQIVFYGRLIHPWMFFLALALAACLAAVRTARMRVTAGVAAWTLAAVSLIAAAAVYRSLAYPSDVLYGLGIDTRVVPEAQKICEFDPGTPYESPAPLNRDSNAPYSAERDYLLVNFCQQFTTGRLPLPPTPSDRALLFDGRHWLTFPAYAFEGFHPEARAPMVRDPHRVRAYGPRHPE
jgi:hypothetical protein